MEDSPEKSFLRKKLFEENYRKYVKKISKFKLTGETKTVRSCNTYGNLVGLRGPYARLFDNALLYDEHKYDTFFPFLSEIKHTESVDELVDWGIPLDNATTIITESIGDLARSSIICATIKIHENVDEYIIKEKNNMVKISYGKEHISLLKGHVEKLLFLYNKTNKFRDGITFENIMTDKKSKRIIDCVRRIFCMTHRYEFYFSHVNGLQGAVNKHVLGVLREIYSINTECFASPLNCYLDNYYSLFYDTDKFFGSKGNFFDTFFPKKGCLELNPPFILEIMNKMALRLNELLIKGSELIFFVIVPHWSDAFFVEYMKNNKFTSMYNILKKKEHNYVYGMQHVDYREWSSNVDSIWFLMTNIKNLPKYSEIIRVAFAHRDYTV